MGRDLDWSDVEADADRLHDEDAFANGWHENCSKCGPMGPLTEKEALEVAFWEHVAERAEASL
jgi:hypothetical protein